MEYPLDQHEESARDLMGKLLNGEDEFLTKEAQYWRENLGTPEGEAKIYKDVILPKIFQKKQFGPINEERWFSPDYPEVVRGSTHGQWGTYHWTSFDQFFEDIWDWRYPQKAFKFCLFMSTVSFLNKKSKYGWGPAVWDMVRFARWSRRYYGKAPPLLPTTPSWRRNQIAQQAIIRKMVRDGRAHKVHSKDPFFAGQKSTSLAVAPDGSKNAIPKPDSFHGTKDLRGYGEPGHGGDFGHYH